MKNQKRGRTLDEVEGSRVLKPSPIPLREQQRVMCQHGSHFASMLVRNATFAELHP